MSEFEGDLVFDWAENGGEFRIEDGEFKGETGFRNAVFLSLLGGNQEDKGNSDETLSWWGNAVKTSDERKFRSTFLNFVRSVPLTAKNLKISCDCILSDLAWLKEDGFMDEINVSAKIEERNSVSFVVNANGLKEEFSVGWR